MNNKDKFQGYQIYYKDNKITHRGVRKNNMRIGYTEYHFIKHTLFCIR